MRTEAAEWNAASTRVVWCAGLFAAAAVAIPLLGRAQPGASSVGARAGIGIGANAAAWVMLGSLLGLLITGLFWTVTVARLSRVHGAPAAGHLGFWGLGAFGCALVLSFLATPALGVPVATVIRVAGASLAVAGVLHTRAWFRRRGEGGQGYSLVSGGEPRSPLAPQPTADDWNTWDPAVQDEIDRRRHR